MGLGLVEGGKIPKPLSKLFNMSRKYSLWMYQWGCLLYTSALPTNYSV